jgi:hypothetical protein
MNEDELRAWAGDLFADEFLEIEITGENTEGLYIERGPIEGGVIRTPGSSPYFGDWPVRDIFPSRPADRGAVQYPTVRTEDFWYRTQPRRDFFRREIRRLRRWWRAHWWPARIRDLEAELRYRDDDWN